MVEFHVKKSYWDCFNPWPWRRIIDSEIRMYAQTMLWPSLPVSKVPNKKRMQLLTCDFFRAIPERNIAITYVCWNMLPAICCRLLFLQCSAVPAFYECHAASKIAGASPAEMVSQSKQHIIGVMTMVSSSS